uniref:Uncharacterized protein n=1 Tax=Clytia hemisphaerica TaxID=252671 RepID=A0A7M5WS59_9CNID
MVFRDVNNKHYLRSFFVFGLFEVLLCSGITYGWASIVYVFKVEYFYYDSLCHESATTLKNNTNRSSKLDSEVLGEDGLPGCLAQDKIFNLIFTVAVFFFTSVQFPTGLFLDKFGPRVARMFGGSIYVLACFGLGFVAIGYENLLFPIFTIICVGGGMLSMSVYQVANIIYRQDRSKIICIMHGAYDSSAVMLLIFKVIYDQGIMYKDIMITYSSICLVLIIFGTFIMTPYQNVLLKWSQEEKDMYHKSHPEDQSAEFMHRSLDASYNMSKKKTIVYKPNGGTKQNDGNASDEEYKMTESNFKGVGNESREDYHGDNDENVNTDDKAQLVESGVEERKEPPVWKTIMSPLYLFELLYLVTFQLKLWYFVGALADDMIRLTNNNKELGK